jgi:predicted PurR-regulated permease PerM
MFAILGGLLFFCPLGFLFGPIALSVFFALFHIYRIFILEEKETV